MLCRDKSKCHSCWSVHWCQAVHATAALRVGVPQTKSDAIRKPEELQCKILDRDNTKEIRPFCIDASKVMRLSYDRCHGRRIHIHSMSRYLADKIMHLQKTPVKKKPILCIRGKKEEDNYESLGRLWSSPIFKEKKLFSLPLTWLWLLPKLQLGDIISMWYWQLRIFFKSCGSFNRFV